MEPGGGKGQRMQVEKRGEGCCVEPPANPCVSRENGRKTTVVVGMYCINCKFDVLC